MRDGNPYRAPSAPLRWVDTESAEAPLPSSDVDGPVREAELRFCIGPRADLYIRKWRASHKRPGSYGILGFHWAAFLVLGLWLPYRKMFRATALCYLVVAGAGVLDYELPHQFPERFREGMVFWPTTLVLPFVGGLWGYAWYLHSTFLRIRAIRSHSRGLADDTYAARLARHGGTSMLAPLVCTLLFWISVPLLGLAIDLIHQLAQGNGHGFR